MRLCLCARIFSPVSCPLLGFKFRAKPLQLQTSALASSEPRTSRVCSSCIIPTERRRPDANLITAARVQRNNLTLRIRMRRLTRFGFLQRERLSCLCSFAASFCFAVNRYAPEPCAKCGDNAGTNLELTALAGSTPLCKCAHRSAFVSTMRDYSAVRTPIPKIIWFSYGSLSNFLSRWS